MLLKLSELDELLLLELLILFELDELLEFDELTYGLLLYDAVPVMPQPTSALVLPKTVPLLVTVASLLNVSISAVSVLKCEEWYVKSTGVLISPKLTVKVCVS